MYLKHKTEHSTVHFILVVCIYTTHDYIVPFCQSVILVYEKFKAATQTSVDIFFSTADLIMG